MKLGKLAALLIALGILALAFVGCARPTAPTKATGPLRLALAGQSNAMLIRPFLAERAEVPAFYGEVVTIAPCWSVSGSCWAQLRPSLPTPLDAFVWSQGEADALADTPNYTALLSELVARVRAAAGQPRLLVVVPQMGPFFNGPRMGALGDRMQRDSPSVGRGGCQRGLRADRRAGVSRGRGAHDRRRVSGDVGADCRGGHGAGAMKDTTVQDVAYSLPLFTPTSQMRVFLACGHSRTYTIADYEGPAPKLGATAQCEECQDE